MRVRVGGVEVGVTKFPFSESCCQALFRKGVCICVHIIYNMFVCSCLRRGNGWGREEGGFG